MYGYSSEEVRARAVKYAEEIERILDRDDVCAAGVSGQARLVRNSTTVVEIKEKRSRYTSRGSGVLFASVGHYGSTKQFYERKKTGLDVQAAAEHLRKYLEARDERRAELYRQNTAYDAAKSQLVDMGLKGVGQWVEAIHLEPGTIRIKGTQYRAAVRFTVKVPAEKAQETLDAIQAVLAE